MIIVVTIRDDYGLSVYEVVAIDWEKRGSKLLPLPPILVCYFHYYSINYLRLIVSLPIFSRTYSLYYVPCSLLCFKLKAYMLSYHLVLVILTPQGAERARPVDDLAAPVYRLCRLALRLCQRVLAERSPLPHPGHLAAFVVGEYWTFLAYDNSVRKYDQNSHRQELMNWVKAAGPAATALDFTTKKVLQAAVQGQLWRMKDKEGKPTWLIGWLPEKAVTFVENHDTGSTQHMWPFPSDKIVQGYAYILTHPGTPCVEDLL